MTSYTGNQLKAAVSLANVSWDQLEDLSGVSKHTLKHWRSKFTDIPIRGDRDSLVRVESVLHKKFGIVFLPKGVRFLDQEDDSKRTCVQKGARK